MMREFEVRSEKRLHERDFASLKNGPGYWAVALFGALLIAGCQVPWLGPQAGTDSNRFLKFYGGPNPDTLVDVLVTADGTYLLGTGYPEPGIQAVVNIVRVDSHGNQRQWKRFSQSEHAQAAFLLPMGDGTYLVGVNSLDSSGVRSAQLLQYSSDLTQINSLTHPQDSNGFDWLTTAVRTADGNILVGGYSTEVDSLKFQEGSTSPTRDTRDAWIWSLDQNLQTRWERRYGFTREDETVALHAQSGTLYALIQTKFPDNDPQDTWSLLRLSTDGFLLDQWTQAGTSEHPIDVTQGSDGAYWVLTKERADGAMRLYRQASPSAAVTLVRSDAELYDPVDLTVDGSGNLWVSGVSQDRRQIQTGEFSSTGEIIRIPATTSASAQVELSHQAGDLLFFADGSLLLGATLGWGNNNSMMTLMRGQAGGVLP